MNKKKGNGEKRCSDEDLALVAGCINKEKDAWDRFAGEYSRLIQYNINRCLRLHAALATSEEKEDLFHTVFHSLLENDCRKLRQFEGRCSLAGWLGIITTRIVIDHLRKRRPTHSLDDEDDQGSPLRERLPSGGSPVSQEEDLLEKQRKTLVLEALRGLSADDRLLAVLVFQKDLPAEKVAAVMNISRDAVHVRKHRLRERLRKKLEDAGRL